MTNIAPKLTKFHYSLAKTYNRNKYPKLQKCDANENYEKKEERQIEVRNEKVLTQTDRQTKILVNK